MRVVVQLQGMVGIVAWCTHKHCGRGLLKCTGGCGCRLWHADVLEWVWFLNSYPEVMYRTMYGDKDTFRIAFHLAGKAEMFSQVCKLPCP